MKEVDISNLKSMSPSSHSPSKSTTESGLQTVETSVESKDKKVCYIARACNNNLKLVGHSLKAGILL